MGKTSKRAQSEDQETTKITNSLISPRHYKTKHGYQLWEYAADVNLNGLVFEAVKHAIRYKIVNGRSDLLKSWSYINKLQECEKCYYYLNYRKTLSFVEQFREDEQIFKYIRYILAGKYPSALNIVKNIVKKDNSELERLLRETEIKYRMAKKQERQNLLVAMSNEDDKEWL